MTTLEFLKVKKAEVVSRIDYSNFGTDEFNAMLKVYLELDEQILKLENK